jgi:aryl-alcohol dehydrogenase-like predicted oxidoreductase
VPRRAAADAAGGAVGSGARVTFFDTAELYGLGAGTNQALLGPAVKPFRDEVVIATNAGTGGTSG